MQEINLDVGPAPESGALPTLDTLEFQDIAHRKPTASPAGANIPMHDMKSSGDAGGAGSAAFPLFDPKDITHSDSTQSAGAYDGNGPGVPLNSGPIAPGGPIGAAGSGSGGSGGGGGGQGSSLVGPKPLAPANASFYQLAYWRSFFDVTTHQMAWRLMRALIPTSSYFYGASGEDDKPDLYGPFWITSTLVFLMAATGNFASYLATGTGKVWRYDMEKLSVAATVFYSFILPIPILVYFALRQFAQPKPLVVIVSLYGYSLISFLPAAIICVVRYELVQWLTLTVCAVLSSRFLIRNLLDYGPNLTPEVAADGASAGDENSAPAQQKRNLLMVMAAVGVMHVGLAVATKLYFFQYTAPDAVVVKP